MSGSDDRLPGRTIFSRRSFEKTTGWNSPNNGATNSSGFAALPGGKSTVMGSGFAGLGTSASFWTATESTSSVTDARHFTLTNDAPEIYYYSLQKNTGASCRCVKN
ncbi:MAG: hypothetical protein IPH45_17940 [Bacteroidales bacterium]|nr:hypothetical protein [Bacteroidales bacterium]